jgi:hypothetical protein
MKTPYYSYSATGAKNYYKSGSKTVYIKTDEQTSRPIVGQTYRVGFENKTVLSEQYHGNTNYIKYYTKAEKYTKVTSVAWYLNSKKVSSKSTYKSPSSAYGKKLWVKITYKATGVPAAMTDVEYVGSSYNSNVSDRTYSLPTVVKHLLWVSATDAANTCYGLTAKPSYQIRQVLASGNLATVKGAKASFQWYYESYSNTTGTTAYHKIAKATSQAYKLPTSGTYYNRNDYVMQVIGTKSGYTSDWDYADVYAQKVDLKVTGDTYADFETAAGAPMDCTVEADAVKGATITVTFTMGSLVNTVTKTMTNDYYYDEVDSAVDVTAAQVPSDGSAPYTVSATLSYGGVTLATATASGTMYNDVF